MRRGLASLLPGLVAVTAFLVLLGACSAPEASYRPDPAQATEASPSAPLDPARVDIPRIGASSTLIGLGRDPAGGWAIPPVDQPGQASWYAPGARPGDTGIPAVILGHVNGVTGGRHVPGVFARLDQLAPGDEVLVTGTDGRSLTFRVSRLQVAAKADYPAVKREALAETDGRELRLFTCTGDLRTLPDGTHSYDSNLVVYASAV